MFPLWHLWFVQLTGFIAFFFPVVFLCCVQLFKKNQLHCPYTPSAHAQRSTIPPFDATRKPLCDRTINSSCSSFLFSVFHEYKSLLVQQQSGTFGSLAAGHKKPSPVHRRCPVTLPSGGLAPWEAKAAHVRLQLHY